MIGIFLGYIVASFLYFLVYLDEKDRKEDILDKFMLLPVYVISFIIFKTKKLRRKK